MNKPTKNILQPVTVEITDGCDSDQVFDFVQTVEDKMRAAARTR